MKHKKEMKAKSVKENKQMSKGSHMKEEVGPKSKGLSHLLHSAKDENGYVGSEGGSIPVTAAENLGKEHGYLGGAKGHIKNGFQPVAGSLDAHDSERNPRKPKEGYDADQEEAHESKKEKMKESKLGY